MLSVFEEMSEESSCRAQILQVVLASRDQRVVCAQAPMFECLKISGKMRRCSCSPIRSKSILPGQSCYRSPPRAKV